MRKHWTKFFIVMMVCAGLLLGAWQTLPPGAPKGLDETPITLNEASPAPDLRMMLSHLRAMTGAPRPLGSEALADAQQYITDQLTQMGAEYEVQRYELGIKPGNALSLNNIIVTVKGKNPDEAVLFVAHTDSVSTGPGAFDDMVSVTALMEAIRALAGQTPARDIVFVLTDGEELGMWGAMRYVKDHPEINEKTSLVLPGLLALAAVFYAPEGSYLLSFPVLFGLAALGVYQLKQKKAAALVLGLGCLIVMMLYVPAVALVYVALGANYAPAAAVMAMLAVTLVMGLSFLLMDMPGLGLKKVQQHQPA